MRADSASFHGLPRRRYIARRLWLAGCAAALLLTTLAVSPAAAGGKPTLGDPAVISSWNLLAEHTFLGDTTKKPQEAFLYLGFVDAAMYDAVVGIDGRYKPYSLHAHAPHGASDQAAAVAAAYKVVSTYSPYAHTTLDAAYAASLAQIPNGQAKTDGIAFGILAADNLIALRVADGRNAPVLFTKAPAPGVWRPTPPGNLAMFVPWMGAVTPLLVHSGAQFGEPGPPPALTSKRYTRDFKEVKALGSAGSTKRTTDQTNTALFFSGNATIQYIAALVDQMQTRHMDIVDAARLFAAVDMSMADAVISVWDAKLPVRVLATDHGDQPGEHGRQRQDDPGRDVGPVARHASVPGLCQRVFRRHRRVHPRPGTDPRHAAPEPDPHLLGRSGRHPALQLRQEARQRRHQRQGLAGDPLPVRGHGRSEDGPPGRRLGARPLLRAPRPSRRLSTLTAP